MRVTATSRLTHTLAGAMFAVASVALAEHPAVPAGPAFQANTTTASNQYFPAVAVGDDGDFVIVWDDDSGQDGHASGVFARRFHSDGSTDGDEFQVNSHTWFDQRFASVDLDAMGNFVIVWTDLGGLDGSGRGIFGQRFDDVGTPVGSEFQVNVSTTGDQSFPRIAVRYDGGFVVTWTNLEGGDDVRARLFLSSGVPYTGEIAVNSYTTGSQRIPALDMRPNGDFIITWYGEGTGDDFGIYAQRFTSMGQMVGDPIQVNAFATGLQLIPSIAARDDGDFVVTWQDNSDRDGSGASVFLRRFASTGAALSDDIQINSYTTGRQDYPVVAMDRDGDHVVVWEDETLDGNAEGIFARLFDSDGSPNGDEFQVNRATTGLQCLPVVGMDADGDFVVAWSDGGSPNPDNVTGQRFADAMIFADGFESGDVQAWSAYISLNARAASLSTFE